MTGPSGPVEVLVSERRLRSWAAEIRGTAPRVRVSDVDAASMDRPRPVRQVLFKTGDIPGSRIADILARHPTIEWIHVSSAGVDTVLPQLGGYRGIVSNGAGVHADAVAEWVVSMVLSHARRLPLVLANSAGGRWQPEVCDDVAGGTLGVVGAGRIGRAVAQRASALGMVVLGTRRTPGSTADFHATYGAGELDKLLEVSHYVVVAAPLTAETTGLIGERALAAMRRDAVLLNVARGPVVDTDALVRALDGGTIAAAYLDVTDPEPLPAEHPLWTAGNVVVSAHSAWRSSGAQRRIIDHFLANLRRWLHGGQPDNVVPLDRGY